jgi:hypothetical protein
MSLLLGNAVPWQKVNDCLRLNFQLPGELVDSYLICFSHASLGFSFFAVLLVLFVLVARLGFRVFASRIFL